MKSKRMTVTLLPEWEEELDTLKKESFYNTSKSELIRYLIKTGLNQIKKERIK
ncbi:ribbon-helix-helix domain-containing protein [[Clostridium] colinum]|uniref:ribbon-helix-helix domain-containing protein n=1 Tax=[Clostridium] colinum TaxID=36835 RepID=UPI0020259F08|nr:ribbon-helix-helix domain-containing protein [[Clostridium] colinum]